MDSPEKPNGCGYFSPGLSGSSGALMFQESQTAPRVYRCGFTLIHQQVGMTVAHCLDENDVETKGTYSVQIGNYRDNWFSIKAIMRSFPRKSY